LAAVPPKYGRQNHAKQILVSSQSSAEEGTQPGGSERLQLKKLQIAMVDQEIFLPGSREGVYGSS
jgi:hypothetical protein